VSDLGVKSWSRTRPRHFVTGARSETSISYPLKRWTGSSDSNNPSGHELRFLNGLWPIEMRPTGNSAPSIPVTSSIILLIRRLCLLVLTI
jgi:hypothetical protein